MKGGDDAGTSTALLAEFRDDTHARKGKARASDSESESEHSDIEVYPPHIHPGYEPPRGAHGMAPPAHPHGTEIHWATRAQKRALWWRSALVTGMFILSW
jgi:hypothetical protein